MVEGFEHLSNNKENPHAVNKPLKFFTLCAISSNFSNESLGTQWDFLTDLLVPRLQKSAQTSTCSQMSDCGGMLLLEEDSVAGVLLV